MGAGPDTKRLEEVRDEFLKIVAEGNYIECACALVGVPRKTLYNWLQQGRRNPDVEPCGSFARDVEKARAKAEARGLLAIRAAEGRDWKAAAWRLERMRPDRWGPPRFERKERATKPGDGPAVVVEFTDGAASPASDLAEAVPDRKEDAPANQGNGPVHGLGS